MTGVETLISRAIESGSAFLRFVSANDLGLTGGHQKGFYIPKACKRYFTPHPPTKGVNHEHPVTIRWADGPETDSCVKWYGTGTRSEYRLTRFNRIRNFYPLQPERLGSVLVLIRTDTDTFDGFILEDETDIEGVQTSLSVDLATAGWALYDGAGSRDGVEDSISRCESDRIELTIESLKEFPTTQVMAEAARSIVQECRPSTGDPDKRLMDYLAVEYELFKALERRLFEPQVRDGFESIEQFLSMAQSMTQRRKSRAGRSLENHFEAILRENGVPFEPQPDLDNTQPDIVVPSAAAYYSGDVPEHELFVIAVKTTCRDRWRQILEEAPRINHRYLVTTQPGISGKQLGAMKRARITVIVPDELHAKYAKEDRPNLMNVGAFIRALRRT